MAIILNLVDESEAGRWICSPLPLHLILFLEPSIKKSQVNAVFIQQTMRVAQADQELIIKQRISILGCQIWSGFVFLVGTVGTARSLFLKLGWYMVSRCFLFHAQTSGKGQPRCLDGSKLQSHHQGLRVEGAALKCQYAT